MSAWSEALKKAPFIGAFFFTAILAVRAAPECGTDHYDEVVTLEKVYDGDTIRLTDGRRVRFIAVNTPELAHDGRPEQAYAAEARQVVQGLFARDHVVKLRFGQDKRDHYHRTLAHVFTEQGLNVSAELIRRGLGFAIVIPPNTWNTECYFRVEKKAKQADKGIWQHPAYKPKQVPNLKRGDTGFQIVEGVVSHIGRGRKSIWLDMGRNFSVRVSRKNLSYFSEEPILALKGKRIRLRGWIAYYNHKLRMAINHPNMLHIIE